jgi:TolA-binding protein
MGRERTGARKFVYVCIACLIFSLAAGCAGVKEKQNNGTSKEKTQPELSSEHNISKEKTRLELSSEQNMPKEKTPFELSSKHLKPKEKTPFELSSEHLLRAKKLLTQGEYEETIKESMKTLSLSGRNSPGDEALFTIGLVYVHYKNPKKNFDKAIGFFERIVRDYPQSQLLEQSQIWIGVLNLIRQSKQVDIEIEEIKKGLPR